MTLPAWKSDCRHFRGDRPCEPHKAEGVHCDDCPHYEPIEQRILIIKLGAIGDVIRTTPILRGLRRRHPHAHITWVTDFPAVVPAVVDRVTTTGARDLLAVEATTYDLVLNLDKDPAACALATRVDAATRKGFVLEQGQPAPADQDAVPKFAAGLFDDVSRANRSSYVEEIFAIAGLRWEGEEYLLDDPDGAPRLDIDTRRPRVGLNTGCGERWPSRVWRQEHWGALAERLHKRGYGVVLLGGPAEDDQNRRLATTSGAVYPGHFPFREFIALVDQLDLVVTTVTMAMHVAIGRRKKLVLLNNIFNPHEFELYGRGEIIEPSRPCDCYYSPRCPHDSMDSIEVSRVMDACVRLLDTAGNGGR